MCASIGYFHLTVWSMTPQRLTQNLHWYKYIPAIFPFTGGDPVGSQKQCAIDQFKGQGALDKECLGPRETA